MWSKTKLAIVGAAGLAILSGTSYYFYRKRKYNLQDPQYLLNQLRNSLFRSKVTPFDKIMQIFTSSYNLQLGSYLLEIMSKGLEIREIKSRICKKDLKGRYFYECLDCSSNLKFHSADLQERESKDCYSHQICEDCFDQEIHKGHQYKLIQGVVEGSCDCGYVTLVKESSFCSKHSGFQSLKKEYDEQLSDEQKQLIKRYFKDLLYILIDGQSDLIYWKMKQHKEKDFNKIKNEQLFVSYNILLTLIMEKISELMDLNHQLVYCFTSLLSEKFEQPVRYRVEQTSFEILDKREVNNKMTILDYIYLLQSSLNQKTIEQFSQLIELLSSADTQFLQFMSISFMKLIQYAIIVEKKKLETGEEYDEHSISNLSMPCSNALGNSQFIHQMIIDNESDQIFILKLTRDVLAKMTFRSENEFWVLQILFSYISNILKSSNTIQEFSKMQELLELLLDLQYDCFKKMIITKTPTMGLMTALKTRLPIINGVFGIQQIIQSLLYTLTSYCVTSSLSQDKKEMILHVMCRRFAIYIEETYQTNKKYREQMKENIGYIGLSLASQIINIIIISEGPELSSENVIKAINKNFVYNHESERQLFINKIAEILHWNLLIYTGGSTGFLMLEFSKIMMTHPQLQSVLRYIWSCLLFGESSIYDSNTLAFQLISLAQRKEDTQLYKFAKQPLVFANEVMYYVYNWKQKVIINHIIMLDQTPLINIDRKLKNVLSKDSNDISSKIKSVIKQIVQYSSKLHQTKKFSQLYDSISECVSDKYLILNVIKELGGYDSEKDTINLQIPQNVEVSSISYGRYALNLTGEINPMDNIQLDISTFKNLFKFQQEYIIKNLFDISIFDRILNLPKAEAVLAVNDIDYFFFYWVELTKLIEDEPDTLDINLTNIIREFKNRLYTKEKYEAFKPIFEEIQNTIQGKDVKRPTCFLLRDSFQEYEKKDELKLK